MKLTIPVKDALAGDRYTHPEHGELMVRDSVPASRFSLFAATHNAEGVLQWALVCLKGDDPKFGIGFPDGPDTPITVDRPDLSQASDRARHLAVLRWKWGHLSSLTEAARRAAHDYEHGLVINDQDRQPGGPYRDYTPSGGTPLSYDEQALAKRLYQEF